VPDGAQPPGSEPGSDAKGARRLSELAETAPSAGAVYEALAGEVLALGRVIQVHVQRLTATRDPGFAVAYTSASELSGRTYTASLSSSVGMQAVLTSGRPLTTADHATLPAELAAWLPAGAPVTVLPVGLARVPGGIVTVVWESLPALSPGARASVESLVAVSAAAIAAVEARLALNTDQTTGCMNGAGLAIRLEEEIDRGRRQATPLSCLLIELDDLDAIGSQYGSAMRDHTLRHVGVVLRREFRRFDRVAYLPDDEFVIVLAGAGGRTADSVARRALGRVHAIKLEVQGSRRPLRVAGALAEWHGSQTPGDLLGEARAASEQAREKGPSSAVPAANAARLTVA
jgi:diguanylate cyclase (GGDEF)-like protein